MNFEDHLTMQHIKFDLSISGMLLITPSAVMSSHLFAVMCVISVSPVIFLTHWLGIGFGLGIGTENSIISNLFSIRVDGE